MAAILRDVLPTIRPGSIFRVMLRQLAAEDDREPGEEG